MDRDMSVRQVEPERNGWRLSINRADACHLFAPAVSYGNSFFCSCRLCGFSKQNACLLSFAFGAYHNHIRGRVKYSNFFRLPWTFCMKSSLIGKWNTSTIQPVIQPVSSHDVRISITICRSVEGLIRMYY